jgi:hypothetical protein
MMPRSKCLRGPESEHAKKFVRYSELAREAINNFWRTRACGKRLDYLLLAESRQSMAEEHEEQISQESFDQAPRDVQYSYASFALHLKRANQDFKIKCLGHKRPRRRRKR